MAIVDALDDDDLRTSPRRRATLPLVVGRLGPGDRHARRCTACAGRRRAAQLPPARRRARRGLGQLLGGHQRAGGGLHARPAARRFARRPAAAGRRRATSSAEALAWAEPRLGHGAGAGLRHRRAGGGAGGAAATRRRRRPARWSKQALAAHRARPGRARRRPARRGRRRDLGRLRAGAGRARSCASARRSTPACPGAMRPTPAARPAAPGAEVRQLRQRRLLHQGLRAARMNEAQARDEICRVGRSLFERGYVHATRRQHQRAAGRRLPDHAHRRLPGLPRPGAAGARRCGRRADSAATARARRWRCTGASTTAAPDAARCVIHTHSTHLRGADAAGRVERGRHRCRRSRPTS